MAEGVFFLGKIGAVLGNIGAVLVLEAFGNGDNELAVVLLVCLSG
jgi:hypothetical protein